MFFNARERARENEFRWRSEFGLGEDRGPSPKKKIETLLLAVRGGAYNAWIAITWELSQPYTCGTNPFQADLTSVPGWNDFDQSRHAELLEAAPGFWSMQTNDLQPDLHGRNLQELLLAV
jgi:hypothetical protein